MKSRDLLRKKIPAMLGKDFKAKPKDMRADPPAVNMFYFEDVRKSEYFKIKIVIFKEKVGVPMNKHISTFEDAGFESVRKIDSRQVGGRGLFIIYQMEYYY